MRQLQDYLPATEIRTVCGVMLDEQTSKSVAGEPPCLLKPRSSAIWLGDPHYLGICPSETPTIRIKQQYDYRNIRTSDSSSRQLL